MKPSSVFSLTKIVIAAALLLLFGFGMAACSPADSTSTPQAAVTASIAPTATEAPTQTPLPTATHTPQPEATQNEPLPATPTPETPTATPLDPANWRELPVVPTVSDRAKAIYQHGQEAGRSPTAFMKLGDCGSATDWYLKDFDRGPEFYDLGQYGDLQILIDQFAGSFERRSVAAEDGFRASSILSEFWADPEECVAGETPLSCEIRIMNPSIALITMGTNDVTKIEAFEPNLRRILDTLIEEGILPVLATKADNLEGDHRVNEIIVSVALDYQLPVWNYWAALQELPDDGLQEDGAHLTWGPNYFNDPAVMEKGWPVRNLTALQVLEAVWRECTGE